MSLVQESLKIFRLSFCHWIWPYLDQKKKKNYKSQTTKLSHVILHHCWTSLILLDKIAGGFGFVFGCFLGLVGYFLPCNVYSKTSISLSMFPKTFPKFSQTLL